MNNEEVINNNYLNWTQAPFDKLTIKEVKKLKSDNPLEFQDSFYKDLSFGTGGMRGILGVGPNRVNQYTFGRNTQGIANFINRTSNKKKAVVIAYDCRNQSEELANKVAEIFSANRIKVYLFSSIRPTPELSYALIKLKCICGIVLTASHNPPEYNGYKVYWKDGGQIVPPIDQKLINEIESLNFNEINFEKNNSNIELIDTDIDKEFIKDSIKNGKIGNSLRKEFKVVFTPIHGTSFKILPDVIIGAGFKDFHIVKEQAIPDGNFSTVKSPNPEEPEALDIAIKKAKRINADIVIGTDPDADRVGLAVKNHQGNYIILNGNQMMIVLTEYILSKKENLNKSFFIGSTVVSTNMIKHLAESYNVDFKVGLTGFKWIGKMIDDFKDQKFISGGEESYGYMVGDFVRDKDAITSALVACELGSECKSNKTSIIDYLIDCYIKYGFYKERLISIKKEGAKGLEEIKTIMSTLRTSKIEFIDENKVVSIKDFESSSEYNLIDKVTTKLNFPKSNVLIFECDDGTTVAARPSGTEPKIKFYISVNSKLRSASNYLKVDALLESKIDRIVKEFEF